VPDVCPCNLAEEFVCPACLAAIEGMLREQAILDANLQELSVQNFDRWRSLNGKLLRIGKKVEIVQLRIQQREWERENA
jgi:hypothetical protein